MKSMKKINIMILNKKRHLETSLKQGKFKQTRQ